VKDDFYSRTPYLYSAKAHSDTVKPYSDSVKDDLYSVKGDLYSRTDYFYSVTDSFSNRTGQFSSVKDCLNTATVNSDNAADALSVIDIETFTPAKYPERCSLLICCVDKDFRVLYC
jgi:hypothetical protein